MRVVITRPASEAQPWAERVRAAGHEPVLIPLIGIEPLADVSGLKKAWFQLGQRAAAMFVSASAVHFFMQERPQMDTGEGLEPIGTRAWATGPGTRQALIAHGWPNHLIDSPPEDAAQFDSEALWAVVKAQIRPGQSVLVIRGATVSTPVHQESPGATSQAGAASVLGQERASGAGRDWLAQQIIDVGALPVFCVSYRRVVPESSKENIRQVRQGPGRGIVWLFSSSEALNNLQALAPGESWAQACAIATHSRIGQRALAVGFGRVHVTRPTVVNILASIESFA